MNLQCFAPYFVLGTLRMNLHHTSTTLEVVALIKLKGRLKQKLVHRLLLFRTYADRVSL